MDHDSHCSARAIQSLLAKIRNEGLTDHISASHQRREKQRLLASDGVFGPINQQVTVLRADMSGTLVVPIVHPLALLQRALKTKP